MFKIGMTLNVHVSKGAHLNINQVCGTDGKSYGSRCLMNREACYTKKIINVLSQRYCRMKIYFQFFSFFERITAYVRFALQICFNGLIQYQINHCGGVKYNFADKLISCYFEHSILHLRVSNTQLRKEAIPLLNYDVIVMVNQWNDFFS